MRFVLNGKSADVRAHPMKRLLDVLREECGLTGTKEGCGEGECGACTVLLDGQAVNACLVPFGQVRGRSVKTIEGLRGRHPLQQAFVTEGGTQCGICTPGMIMAAAALPKNASLRRRACRPRGQHLPVHGVRGDLPGGEEGTAGLSGSRLTARPPVARKAGEMRTAISTLELVEPRSLKHALDVLRDQQPIVPLAGGTDVYVLLNAGTPPGSRYLNLWNLDALRGITMRDGAVSIGALTTFSEIMRSPVVRKRVPMLAAAAREIGAVQIQNRGTLGGNVANGSPAGDSLPVLAAVDAVVVLRSADGVRRVPFNGFYTGYRKTVMRPDELVAAIEIPPVAGAAVVPQGRHAGGAGDLEGGHCGRSRASPAHRVRQRRADGRARASNGGGAGRRRFDRRGGGHARHRDHADRRHPIDRGVPPPRGVQPASPVLDGDVMSTQAAKVARSRAAGEPAPPPTAPTS